MRQSNYCDAKEFRRHGMAWAGKKLCALLCSLSCKWSQRRASSPTSKGSEEPIPFPTYIRLQV
ncbi:hypothetical protein Trco_004787 [Trichoderma cornu-damae]|uniref:Uncharacterized protein n=1 Tax=Trichoderma cornu-damae TaxID=654480 RepID=A0A9P8TVV0_9HYPO|nr:hypothetical protein Trco_004787 [Trichoderma cornu-damae]